MKLSMIGLGMMGLGMARHLLKAGHELDVFDLSADACAAVQQAGARVHASAAEATAGADLLLLMVASGPQCHAALFESGAAAALNPGAVVLICSTIAPSEARAIAAQLATMGLSLVDAPVSGGQVGANAGQLTIMASGPDAAMARVEPVLQAFAKKIHNLGSVAGLGSTYKVVHQLAAGVHLVAAAELMNLGVQAGCDAQRLFDIVSTSAGNSWMFSDRAPRMLQDDPAATSTVDIFIKDLGLVLQTGQESAASLPLAAAAFQMLVAARGLGHGRDDDSQVIQAYRTLTGAD